ncbi:hypothetical protein OIU85_000117 [Salix viminalis]|uniref:Protein kinase domain-containing protein n=1 Tax=Salix viminalis TaxID=40686 RepID=A0A9Q0ZWS1_SALVM|nr:hypothetical protein OIU85_000117 [Salix viminalis]
MENGSGRFGEVYESNLRHKIKLSVRKISPPSEQREKDELKSDIDRKISPPSEKREKDELKSDIDRKISPPSKQREKDELKSDNFLDILKSLSHENLVRLVDGYSNKDLHLLIYEYMETGSLHKALFAIKARGSRVYLAPEHALGKAITVKADVYSYGIVVLEIVSGKSNAEYNPNQEADFLLDTACRLHQDGKIRDLVDKKLGSRFDNKQALTLLHLAMECISQSPTLRPSMSEVVTKLSDIKASAPSSSSEVVPQLCDTIASALPSSSEVVPQLSDIKASAAEAVPKLSDTKASGLPSGSEVVPSLSDTKANALPSSSEVVPRLSDIKASVLPSHFEVVPKLSDIKTSASEAVPKFSDSKASDLQSSSEVVPSLSDTEASALPSSSEAVPKFSDSKTSGLQSSSEVVPSLPDTKASALPSCFQNECFFL